MKTASGATVVQIVEKRHGVRRIVALREVAHELRQMGTADAETASWTIAGMTNKSSGAEAAAWAPPSVDVQMRCPACG